MQLRGKALELIPSVAENERGEERGKRKEGKNLPSRSVCHIPERTAGELWGLALLSLFLQ